MLNVLAIFLLTAVTCWLLGHVVRPFLTRCGVIDRPNERSSHTQPTVRGGGLAVVATLTGLGLWLCSWPVLGPLVLVGICVWVLAAVSFVDDLRSLGAAIRFGCHLAAALVVCLALGPKGMGSGLLPGMPLTAAAVLVGLLVCLWVVGYTNAFNFMDGINGIAGGQAAVTGLGMAWLAGSASGDWTSTPVSLSVGIAGAALGFLPHNFPKARMFMGDVGSAPLGFLLAVLVIWLASVAGWWLVIPLALLHANFVLDTGITLCRRIVRGERWHEAHREHFYQRLVRAGKSHAFVTGWEIGLQCLVVLLMVAYAQVSLTGRLALSLAVVLIWLAFFTFCEFTFRSNSLSQSGKFQSPALMRQES